MNIFKSIKMFFYINSILIGLAQTLYTINFFNAFIRNLSIMFFIWSSSRHKENIHESNRQIRLLDYLYFISSSSIQTLTEKIIPRSDTSSLLLFPIKLFLFEVIFDLLHYSIHRMLHKNWYFIHKVHHYHNYPRLLNTFYHHPLDLLFVQCIPLIFCFWLIPFSDFQVQLVLVYIDFIEISGHSGKKIRSSCFPLCIWLPKFLGIELYTADHDLHHNGGFVNFSKRFSLWDRVFGTLKR